MKKILFTGALAMAAIIACNSPKKAPAAAECPATAAQQAASPDVAVPEPKKTVKVEVTPYQAKYPATASAEAGEVFTDFAQNAFPPTMPEDSSHADAWLKDDCLKCHEDGSNGATRVSHRGMSRALLQSRCRTCHVPDNKALATAEGSLEELLFARNAFPPTLPNDKDHQGAWLRDDCLKCHQGGIARAPKVQHEGMSSILLEAQCRTCHVASAPSGEMDYPEK
ncbi:MAG: hypothetical protein GY930_03275 [bacterium]|nr:hypothetical protein [bacterium]